MKLKITLISALLLLAACSLWANNLKVSPPALVGQNSSTHSINIEFNVGWENSWRNDTVPGNWDAVWLFVKYRRASDGNWYHATLNSEPQNHNTGSQGTGATIKIPEGAKGAMYYRSANGTGTFATTGVKLRWEYGTDGISDSVTKEISEIMVLGIEMVYVPQGAFYIGDGTFYPRHYILSDAEYSGGFYSNGTDTLPYRITSENEIPFDTIPGSLNGIDTIVPSAFPKGFNAFYCMKYEMTQEQYADFLNLLTPMQQCNRSIPYDKIYRQYIKKVNGVFGCDANDNDILNEAQDGQNVACNYIDPQDGLAYADWSGLSPMTEFEFEKACRGPKYPLKNECVWGDTNIIGTSALLNAGSANEMTAVGNCNLSTSDSSINKASRVGMFAKANTNRTQSGASYFGIMDLGGNVWESVIPFEATTASFSGKNGVGKLNKLGYSEVSSWPSDKRYLDVRGGTWSYAKIRVSNHDLFYYYEIHNGKSLTNRSWINGFRCVIRSSAF